MYVDLGIALEGFFFEKVNGSTGQQVTFTFTMLYMHHTATKSTRRMIADDTRLTPHHCKKHTASFARSTGIFPSSLNICCFLGCSSDPPYK